MAPRHVVVVVTVCTTIADGYTGQPVLTANPRYEPGDFWEQSFTVCMPLLSSASAFGLGGNAGVLHSSVTYSMAILCNSSHSTLLQPCACD